jgi:hypothetical protein
MNVGESYTRLDHIDEVACNEWDLLTTYFKSKGLPEDIAKECAERIDWTDEQFNLMLAE